MKKGYKKFNALVETYKNHKYANPDDPKESEILETFKDFEREILAKIQERFGTVAAPAAAAVVAAGEDDESDCSVIAFEDY